MDENSLTFEEKINNDNDDHGWQTVSYQKRSRKQQVKPANGGFFSDHRNGGGVGGEDDVFRAVEVQAEERRRRLLEAKRAAESPEVDNSALNEEGEYGSDVEDGGGLVENGVSEEKKSKPKKPKKPKVTVAEAAAQMDADDLATFIAEISASYDTQQDMIQLMRFADYFGRAFAKVNASQFPWVKLLKESSVAKMADIPLVHVTEDIYKMSTDWLNQRSFEALGSFVLWSLDSILADLTLHQGAMKGSKKVAQQAPSKSQVAIFVVLAMVVRRKPDVLISLLPILKENTKYQGQDKLPVIVWVITQACVGDLGVGLFMWVHFLLPMVTGRTNCSPQSRDLILQLVERIISFPKARTILVNGAARKGERLIPPSAIELLMRATFPAPSARLKATERFEVIYPTLKEVGLAASPGSKAMKQITQQILPFAIKASGEGHPDLASEASNIFIWCLTQNSDCLKQWDNIYLENLEGSVVILKRLSDEWKMHSIEHLSVDQFKATLNSFRVKNENALTSRNDVAREAALKDAQKYCKTLLAQVSRGYGCLKIFILATVAMAIGAAFISKDLQSWDVKKLLDFNFP